VYSCFPLYSECGQQTATERSLNGLGNAQDTPNPTDDLRPEQVYAALTYFYDHHDLLVQELEATAFAAERERLKQPITRAELLKRRADQGS